MTPANALAYHRERADRELEAGLIAKSLTAARSHLRLAALHMQRVRDLATSGAPPLLFM